MRIRAVGVIAVIVLAGACSSGDDSDVAADDATESATTTTAAAANPYEGYTSEIYAAADKWICRPDLPADQCRDNLDVTVVNADGSTEVVPHELAEDPPVDCFYVYPTVNFGDQGNTTFDAPATDIEVGTTHAQAGGFSSVCRVFAPRYRQLTLGGFSNGDAQLAYGDVVDAFKHYMANDNDGRGIVLMGHSQGSGHLASLIADEIDDDPVLRDQLVSALLIGTGVEVPAGADVGGAFQNVPACRDATQVGCVVSYASFRSTAPPPDDSFFGRVREGDGQVLCTNPAALGGGAAPLHAMFPAPAQAYAPETPGPPIEGGLVALPELLTGACVERGGFVYLEVTVNGDPADPRTDTIGGDLTPEWGLHAVDTSLALGDLVDLVASQRDAWVNR